MIVKGSPGGVSLLICDDHRMLTDALAVAIGLDPDLEMVAEPVDNGEAAVAICADRRPDVVLMDVQLKGRLNGIEATRRIREVSPSTQVVVVTGSVSQEEILLDAVDAGASGVMDKADAVDRIFAVVKDAAAGEAVIDGELLARLLQRAATGRAGREDGHRGIEQLTSREREVLALVAEGLSNDDIAIRLHLSVRTVRNHVQNILRKLEVHSKLEAAAFAVRNGLASV